MRVALPAVLERVSGGGAWDGLYLGALSSPAGPGLDGRLVWSGRLRLPRTPGSVPVELRLSPYSSAASFVELVVTGRGRFPRRYWASGHDALSALKRSVGTGT